MKNEKLRNMTDAQLAAYYNTRKPLYRRLLSKLTSLVRIFTGKHFTATAADVRVKVSEGGVAETKTQGLVVENMRVPSLRALRKFLDVLEMRDELDELEFMMEKSAKSENKTLQTLAKNIERDRNLLLAAYKQATKGMEDIAEDHLPDEVGAIFMQVQDYFNDLEENQRKAQEAQAKKDPSFKVETSKIVYTIIVGLKDGVVDFILNCDITHWPTLGVVTRANVVVVTARLTPTDEKHVISSYVTVLDKIGLPNAYTLGSTLKGTTAKSIVESLNAILPRKFAAIDVAAFAAPVNLNLDVTDVTNRLSAIEGITGVNIEENEVVLEYTANREIQAQVMRLMRSLKPVKNLLSQGYTPRLREIEPGMNTFSMTLQE